jgi:hypothetical protein
MPDGGLGAVDCPTPLWLLCPGWLLDWLPALEDGSVEPGCVDCEPWLKLPLLLWSCAELLELLCELPEEAGWFLLRSSLVCP